MLRPKPRSTTAVCRIYFDVKLIPALIFVRSVIKSPTTMPINIAKIGPPIMGKILPSANAGAVITRQRRIPLPFFLIKLIYNFSFSQHNTS
jgi:hypothetical protein